MSRGKKAERIKVLDMRRVCNFCDYFVVLETDSLRQLNALAKTIQEELDKKDIKPLFPHQGEDESGWIVLDYFSVIVHLFHSPLREFYDLEHLWQEAKRVKVPKKLSQ
ncbi:MAG: ribosome silencing factor [Candidatus Omnitrophica bacterium]|nr:ribosome silencing factor [Candidatus Omnitrophota bacterium]